MKIPTSRLLRFVCAVLLAVALRPALYAQFDTGGITGLVKDATGSVVPGARLTLSNAATGFRLTSESNDAGIYEFPTVRVGTYKITAEKAGFSVAEADSVVVSVATRTRVDLRLTVGEVTQTVEVTGASPVLETDTSQRG